MVVSSNCISCVSPAWTRGVVLRLLSIHTWVEFESSSSLWGKKKTTQIHYSDGCPRAGLIGAPGQVSLDLASSLGSGTWLCVGPGHVHVGTTNSAFGLLLPLLFPCCYRGMRCFGTLWTHTWMAWSCRGMNTPRGQHFHQWETEASR